LKGAALDYFASRGQKVSPQQAEMLVKSMLQSKVYQKNYQIALQKQVDGILDKMHTHEFKAVNDYLNTCYEDGFIGAMFDLQGQGIPLCFPLDQEAMVRAVQLDSKISQGLYSRLGEDVSTLKKHITSEISRGIANGMSYEKIAQQIGFKMMGTYNTPGGAYAKALRIARTEGHRIQCQGTMDACFNAKEKGADVVKQWDATLDSATRESHQKVDGEIRELDEKFSNGLMFPGDPSGGASEVVNCRCALLQRARWGLDEAELETLKERAKYFGLDKSDIFEDYKKKYLKASKELTNNSIVDIIQAKKFTPAKTIEGAKEYANNVLGLKCSGYENMNVDVANVVNREIQAIYDVFGDVNNNGYLNGIKVIPKKQRYVAAYSPSLKEIYFTKNNVGYKSALSKMKDYAEEQFGYGFWSSNYAEHSIRHELGHAVENWYTRQYIGYQGRPLGKLKTISDLRKDVMQSCGITKWSMTDSEEHMKAAGNIISYYGLRNDGEFIAECIAEYMGGNPRETAKKVVEILLKG
jgi:hypothetical protein